MALTITKITDDYSTSPQITPNDITEIAKLGFKTIINNRPDMEGGADQPTSQAIAEAAKQQGLHYVYIPVVPNQIQDSQVDSFRQALSIAPKPALGFCRTGNRASQMYARANVTSGQQSSGPFQAMCAWMKSKCLITRFVRWVKTKQA